MLFSGIEVGVEFRDRKKGNANAKTTAKTAIVTAVGEPSERNHGYLVAERSSSAASSNLRRKALSASRISFALW